MLLPPDLRDWLPEDHMVHFILDVVQSMDFSGFSVNQRGKSILGTGYYILVERCEKLV